MVIGNQDSSDVFGKIKDSIIIIMINIVTSHIIIAIISYVEYIIICIIGNQDSSDVFGKIKDIIIIDIIVDIIIIIITTIIYYV